MPTSTKLTPDARTKVDSLIAALRRRANDELIALRALNAMGHAPSHQNRLGWLEEQLPEAWHFQRAKEALSNVRSASGVTIAEPTPGVDSSSGRRRRSARRNR